MELRQPRAVVAGEDRGDHEGGEDAEGEEDAEGGSHVEAFAAVGPHVSPVEGGDALARAGLTVR